MLSLQRGTARGIAAAAAAPLIVELKTTAAVAVADSKLSKQVEGDAMYATQVQRKANIEPTEHFIE